MLVINRYALNAALIRENVTIGELARRTKISTRMISGYLNAEKSNVRLSTLARIWRALKTVSLGELIFFDGTKEALTKMMKEKVQPVKSITKAAATSMKVAPKQDLPPILNSSVTERQFAALVGISPAMAHKLKVYGVCETGYDGRILLEKSLREYYLYLAPHKRSVLVERLQSKGYDHLLA